MIPKDFHGGFRVGIKGWFEPQLRNANFLKKGFNRSNQVSQTQIIIRHESLDLMEFTQMCGIHSFIAKDAVNGKVTSWFETALLIGQLVEHLRRHCRRVRPQEILKGFFLLKIITISNTARSTHFVHRLDAFIIVFGDTHSSAWFLDKERVVRITGWMRLRLKERIKVPKGGFDPLVGGHFGKAHFKENFAEFGAHLEQGMKVAATDFFTHRLEIVGLKGSRLPGTRVEHFLGNVSGLLDADGIKGRALADFEGFAGHEIDKFAFLEILGELY